MVMRMRAVMAFERVDGPSVVHLAFRLFHRSHDRYIIVAYDHKLIQVHLKIRLKFISAKSVSTVRQNNDDKVLGKVFCTFLEDSSVNCQYITHDKTKIEKYLTLSIT